MTDFSGDVLRLELVYANEKKEAALLQRLKSEQPITSSEQRFLSSMLDENGKTEFQLVLQSRNNC